MRSRSTNRKRALLISGAIILLCMTIIMGTTYALFTDDEQIENHLQAGNLDITLTRTKLVSTYLTEDGFLDTKTNNDAKDFTNNANENVFDIGTNTLIVPKCAYTADMLLTNNSKVAFSYWIEIVYNGAQDVDLAEQIQVTVTGADKPVRLNQGLIVGSATDPIGTVAVNKSGAFTVSIEFLDLDVNNDAMSDSLSFDLVVHAVQATKAPTP